MSERFPIATHHKKRLYVPEKRMYQLWTPPYNQGVGTLYLIPIEMPMGPRSNIPPISMMEVTLSSTSMWRALKAPYSGVLPKQGPPGYGTPFPFGTIRG